MNQLKIVKLGYLTIVIFGQTGAQVWMRVQLNKKRRDNNIERASLAASERNWQDRSARDYRNFIARQNTGEPSNDIDSMIVVADTATYIVGNKASDSKPNHPVMAGMIDKTSCKVSVILL